MHVAIEDDRFVVDGGGLSESYLLADVERVEVSSNGSRFGLMAPGEITGFLLPESGMHMVRIDAKRLGGPRKAELQAFGHSVVDAVLAAGGTT